MFSYLIQPRKTAGSNDSSTTKTAASTKPKMPQQSRAGRWFDWRINCMEIFHDSSQTSTLSSACHKYVTPPQRTAFRDPSERVLAHWVHQITRHIYRQRNGWIHAGNYRQTAVHVCMCAGCEWVGLGGWGCSVFFFYITPEPLTKITALLKEQSGACALGPSASQELFPALTLWNESCNLVVCQQQLHPSYD